MPYKKSLFIFRRDLRIYDNTGLGQALAQSQVVVPCFIFDPRQCRKANRYKSSNALQFMIESLRDLDSQLGKSGSSLLLLHGNPEVVIKKLVVDFEIEAIFVNADYTPFSRRRDDVLAKLCAKIGCAFHSFDDLLLMGAPDRIMTKRGTPVRIFTPFYRQWLKIAESRPKRIGRVHFGVLDARALSTVDLKKEGTSVGLLLRTTNDKIFVHGGRSAGLKLLKKIKTMGEYGQTKDYPALPTTYLSAHHKFGTISIRETAHEIIKHHGVGHELLRELCWRDFFTYLLYHFPHLLGSQCRKVSWQWRHDKRAFKAWCMGKTGLPFIDIGMQMLNETGFMPNRMRMVTASYLTKNLRIDWRWGERYFAQQLVDYDPAVNNGNWQWVASTGCDAQPPFRRFNPLIQMKKFGDGLLLKS